MNYVNKDNAIGLKEIGFKEACISFYKQGIVPVIDESTPQRQNDYPDLYAAPDFLSAADWFWLNHKIEILLYPDATEIEDFFYPKLFEGSDHRNAAIAAAIKMVKEKQKHK